MVVALLFLQAVLLFTWPAFRDVSVSTLYVLVHPVESYLQTTPPESAPTPQTHLALLARSMEFRIQEFRVTPAAMHTWCVEWKCGSMEEVLLLRLLLRQLPEAGTKDSSPGQRQDLIQTIQELSTQIKKTQPDNAFPYLADALVSFYLGQDASAVLAIQQGQRCSRLDLGLRELNRSEYALWRQDSRKGIVLPPTPRNWSIELDRPIQALSRDLVVQEKTLLQKYNIERAVEITLLHLALTAQISEAAWGPADHAIAHSMAHRALEPYWTSGSPNPDLKALSQNFFNLLEDQGDHLSSSKVKGWSETWIANEEALTRNLNLWRWTQSLALWNVSSIISSLFLQTCSVLLAWFVLLLLVRKAEAPDSIPALMTPNLAFFLVPIFWSVTHWPPGVAYLIAGLIATWILWSLRTFLRTSAPPMLAIRGLLARGLVLLLIASTAVTSTATLAWLFRERLFQRISETGWIGL